MTDKTFFDHVSDWFRILLKSGVPALLIGLGWLAVILGSFYFGGAWNNGAGFWVVDATGIMMIILGVKLHIKEVDTLSRTADDETS